MLFQKPKLFAIFSSGNFFRTKANIMATKPAIPPTGPVAVREHLNDVGIRAVLIPFFGIGIPLVTGMIPHQQLSLWQIKLSYCYTIAISFLIIQGSRYLHFTLRSYFDWLNKPVQKLIALILTIPFFTIPVSALLLSSWYDIFLNGQTNWAVIRQSSLIILIAVFFLVHIYETVFLVKQTENDQLKKAQLERSRMEAELEALKNQIDPHFIFNSLNTLSHLIEARPKKARQFNDNLADVYRYILQNKKRDLVLLQEEIDFVNDYFSLLKIRFENAVQFNCSLQQELLSQYLIPPISLQVLMENAIKHNEFSDLNPLQVSLSLQNGRLVFSNPLQQKQLRKPSSKTGLHNLKERYRLSTQLPITIFQSASHFTVELPLLKLI